MFNMFSVAAFPANCGYGNFSVYTNAVFGMLQGPWNGAYPGFTRLYVGVDVTSLKTKWTQLRQGLRAAHDRGVKIEVLMDGTAWVKTAAGVATGLTNCQLVAWFNGNATDVRDTFDGMHYDIEPHTLGAAWMTNYAGGTDRYNNAWEANLIAIFRGCQAIFSGTSTTVAWDVPDDYYNYNTDLWIPLVQNPYVDYVSVMAYHDTVAELTNGIGGIGGVTNVLASLAGSGVPALFGVESSDPRLAPADISFWQEGVAPLEAALAVLDATYGPGGSLASPLYQGTSVHYNFAFGVLPLNGFGTSGLPVTSCNVDRGFLFAFANDTIYVSMKLFRASTNTFLKTYDVTNYIPGPWEMSIANAGGVGPYRIELYDGAGGTQLAPSSPVGLATCATMA